MPLKGKAFVAVASSSVSDPDVDMPASCQDADRRRAVKRLLTAALPGRRLPSACSHVQEHLTPHSSLKGHVVFLRATERRHVPTTTNNFVLLIALLVVLEGSRRLRQSLLLTRHQAHFRMAPIGNNWMDKRRSPTYRRGTRSRLDQRGRCSFVTGINVDALPTIDIYLHGTRHC